MTMDRLELTLSAALEELGRMGENVAAFCERNGIDEKTAYSLQLVCDEWVTNVILHGYGAAPPQPGETAIEMSLARADGETVRLTFVDRAPAFDPLARPEPNVSLPVEERQAGGLGIHFIKKYMDRCEYERIGGRNRLSLTKTIRLRGESQDEHNG